MLAQDLAASYGKVMRLRPDGSAPPDNPFVGEPGVIEGIWSFGPSQRAGRGDPSRVGRALDRRARAEGRRRAEPLGPGLNFGWPEVSYGVNYNGSPVGDGVASAQDIEEPVYFWDPVIAPGGMAFYQGELFADWQGDLLIASLNPGALVRLELDGAAAEAAGAEPRVVGEEWLLTDAGRIRDVEVAADGAVLVLTDAADGSRAAADPRADYATEARGIAGRLRAGRRGAIAAASGLGGRPMTAFNVVRMRAKPGRVDELLADLARACRWTMPG